MAIYASEAPVTSIGADPPEVLEAYAVEEEMRERRFSRNWFLFTAAAIAALFTLYFVVKAEARGAACFRHGVPAVCRSPAIEQKAKAIVLRRCKRCDPSDVTDWIYSFQMNRGPYESAAELASDVLQQVRR